MSSSLKPHIRFFVKGVEVETLDLGIIPAGGSKRFVIGVVNDGVPLENLRFSISNKDVIIIDAPDVLGEGELVLDYSPPLGASKGLVAKIEVEGVYVV